jgi:hypothetical protein
LLAVKRLAFQPFQFNANRMVVAVIAPQMV